MNLKLLLTCTLCALTFLLTAQDAEDLIKDANKALSSYYLDPSGNQDKLAEAKAAVDQAFSSGNLTSDYKSNLTRAQVNTELVANDYKMLVLDPSSPVKSGNAATEAMTGIADALKTADKKFHQKETLKVLSELAPYLSVIGNSYINTQQYDKAYQPLSMVLRADQLLTSNGEQSIFEQATDLENHKYVTAVCGLRAGENEKAQTLLMDLYNSGTQEVGVYTELYNLLVSKDEAKAMEVLNKAKEIDPENTELLFAEINYYIKEGQFDKLEDKLKLAIEKDPDNPSVRSALGNVYMQLGEQATADGDTAAQAKYFKSAMDYFNQTLELDSESFDAHYSIGSLYFNKAAAKTKEMQNLGLSREDQARYEQLDEETHGLFVKALPYFKKAEMLNPSDLNTLIALKEIFARQDQLELSKVFKTRIEDIQGGGIIEKSYFAE